MAEQHVDESPPSRRMLTALKGALALFLIIIVLGGHGNALWPLVTWPMYDTYVRGKPAKAVSSWQLHAVSSTGAVYRFWERDIYGALPSDDGERIVQNTFSPTTPIDQPAAFQVLLDRVQTLLPGVEIVRLEYWQLSWRHVNAKQTPPFDVEHPDELRLLGSIQVADPEDDL